MTFALSHTPTPIREIAPETIGAWPPAGRTETAARILLVDPDEASTARTARLLGDHGFAVSIVPDAVAADAQLAANAPDLVILETALAGEDGLSLCRRLALRGTPPILILAARCEAMDRVIALEFGADDVMAKDSHPLELVARVRAALRRRPAPPPQPQSAPTPGQSDGPAWGAWRLDVLRRELRMPDGGAMRLSPTELRLLAAFFERPHEVLSRDDLRRLACRNARVADRSMDVMTCRLRRKLERRTGCRLIVSVRGRGYALSSLG